MKPFALHGVCLNITLHWSKIWDSLISRDLYNTRGFHMENLQQEQVLNPQKDVSGTHSFKLIHTVNEDIILCRIRQVA